jgi:predicted dehydrogenase
MTLSICEKVKAILVGCGGITTMWLQPIQAFRDVDIVGLVDINLGNAKKKQEEFHLHEALVTDSLAEAINKTDATVVFDCSIPEAHAQVTIEALSGGCHVLGEKPMADTMEHAWKMLNTAQEYDRLYAVIQNRRYQDGIRRYRGVVQSGKIGPLTTLNADFYIGAHFGGFRAGMKHVLILDMAIHTFDQARMISNKDPVAVYCYDWNPRGSWYHHGASASVIFEMSDGVIFNYRGSWCSEGFSTSWQGVWRAIGEQGTALWDGEDEINAQTAIPSDGLLWETQDETLPPIPSLSLTGHGALIREFIDCVKNGGTPQTICTDNIKSLAMVHAAIKSAELGQRVLIEQ